MVLKINFPTEATNAILRSMREYAELTYGKCARYLGTFAELTINNQVMRFKLVVDGDKAEAELKPVEWKENYVTLEDWPIEVKSMERYFFKNEKDAIDWLKMKSVRELSRLSVVVPGKFDGTALFYVHSYQ